MKVLIAFLLLCGTASAQSYLEPNWIFMPESTKAERIQKEKARLTWIKRRKQLAGIAAGEARKKRIVRRKHNGYYDRYRTPMAHRRYFYLYYRYYRR